MPHWHTKSRLDPALRTRLVAEFRERWTRAGRPGQVQHILGNMSQAHGVPLIALKDFARTVRAEHEQHAVPADRITPRPVTPAAALAIVDGSTSSGHAPPTTASRAWTSASAAASIVDARLEDAGGSDKDRVTNKDELLVLKLSPWPKTSTPSQPTFSVSHRRAISMSAL